MSRPKSSSRTGIFEDLGSSFKPRKPYPEGKKTSSPRKRRSPSLSDFGSDSDGTDELDCLSKQSTRTDADKKQPSNSQNHRLHSYHPDVLTSRSNALKGLKFSRKLDSTEGSKKKTSPNRPKPQPKAKAKAKEPRYRSARETDSEDEIREPAGKGTGNSMGSSTNVIPRPKPRPRPRPIPRPLPPPDSPPDSLFGTPKAPSRTASLSVIPLPSPLSSQKTGAALRSSAANTSSSSSTSKSPASSSHPPPSSSPSYCSKRTSLSSSRIAPRLPQSFPNVSPLVSPVRKRSTVAATRNFPTLSPLDKSAKNVALPKAVKRKDKGKRKALDRNLQPFPMSTQDFGGVPISSDDDSDADGRHARKRRYQEHIEELSDMDLYEEEDSLFMSPAMDPKTLCPYCDEPLPKTPTLHLHRLLKTIYKKSHPDPRSTNPLGRKAPLSIFASVCQRHRFESEILPEAETKGWPKDIDWERLGTRIENLREDLRAIVDDPGPKNVDVQALEGGKGGGEGGMFMLTNFIGKGPRLQCVFWREAMKAVLVRGTRALNGVRAQFIDFDRSQPGYYGGLGSMIIHQTLLNMFPLDSFDPQKITPFTANDFIQRILIPEVALQLIMEDLGLKGLIGAETAFQVLRDSTAYGAAMFPEDSGESAVAKKKINYDEDGDCDDGIFDIGIGDRIVMERARKRRKEIEDEIESCMEPVMDNEEEEGKRKRREWDPLPIETASEVDERTFRTSPRRKASSRRKKKADIGTGSDAMSITDGEEGTDSGMKTDGSLRCSRPKRNKKAVNYTDYSSDDGNDIRLEKRGRKKKSESRRSQSSLSKSRISRSPSASKWPISQRPIETEAKFQSKDPPLSTFEIPSSDEEEKGSSKIKSRILARSPSKKRLGGKAYMGKDGEKGGTADDVDMDTNLNTPMPKGRAIGSVAGNDDVDLTPRPGLKPDDTKSWSSEVGIAAHESVLARARARAQGTNVNDRPKNNMASTSKTKPSSKKTQWASRMHVDPVSDGSSVKDLSLNSGCSSGSEDDEMFRKKRKGNGKEKEKKKKTGEHSWILSDISSQEGQSLMRQNSRSTRR
ncbi:hypothetical protein AGABI2DRAFT_119001 [Agaricus bisporus var. bisporus H97]|uniref:hypothetical protein n=1 Tax=Agaricus bisporus var. bisporus (strain H97 / ATCC MYA-4626 / FGSC 10389) TaxID=936046 RepID=UPI00029F73A1|nr:hypothetical protein AGABI2DRAFT_119001 [Agaricus bisporus var. bisporus H97]EKV46821.1 hypothetical protein AGABI2DRAFT_119001 [Agaricus bisporus var. bisporus H97]